MKESADKGNYWQEREYQKIIKMLKLTSRLFLVMATITVLLFVFYLLWFIPVLFIRISGGISLFLLGVCFFLFTEKVNFVRKFLD